MKYYLHLISLMLLSNLGFGQSGTYNNEWIDYEEIYFPIPVTNDGVYRIPYSTLQNAGLPNISEGYHVITRGEEIVIHASSPSLTADGYLEFYGQENDGSFDTQLYVDEIHQPQPNVSMFNDTIYYYLYWNDGLPSQFYSTIENNISGALEAEEYFTYKAERNFNNVFTQGESFNTFTEGLNATPDFVMGEGWVSSLLPNFSGNEFDEIDNLYRHPEVILTPRIYTNGIEPFDFYLKFYTRNDDVAQLNDHHLKFQFGDTYIYEELYNGFQVDEINVSGSAADLSESNVLNIESLQDLNVTPGFKDQYVLGHASVQYPRQFLFQNRDYFEFNIENNSNKYFEISQFNGDNELHLWDLTNSRRMTVPEVAGNYPVELPAGVSNASQLVIFNPNEVSEIHNLTSIQFTDFGVIEAAADYFFISHPFFIDDVSSPIQEYATYRSSANGGSFQTKIVNVEELYHQFAFGIFQHSLAIQSFVKYIFDQSQDNDWSSRPEYVLLVGNSVVYKDCKIFPDNYAKNYVPTYGTNGSDIQLFARNKFAFTPLIPVGRLSVLHGNEITSYLDKVKIHETLNREVECDPKKKFWRKQVLMIAGGTSLNEASVFRTQLNGYKTQIQDSLMASKVQWMDVKSSSAPILPVSDRSFELLDQGVSLISYVGHSNTATWGHSIGEPSEHENMNRYPFIVSNACFVGNVHSQNDNIMARNYILAKESGGIGFLATVGLSYSSLLDKYTKQLYQNIATDNYGASIGECIYQNIFHFIDSVEYDISNPDGIRLTCQEFNLQGDPAIKLLYFEQPDLVLRSEDISFSPSILTSAIDSFTINVVIYNLGKYLSEPTSLSIYQNENELWHTEPIESLAYSDTIHLKFPMDQLYEIGFNDLSFALDKDNEIVEDCDDNNTVNKQVLVYGNGPILHYPCNYMVLEDSDFEFIAESSEPLLEERSYTWALDTVPTFDSNFLLQQETTASGGIMQWKPNSTWFSGKTYYWRVIDNTESNDDVFYSSFTFDENLEASFSLNHSGQYASLSTENVYYENQNWQITNVSETSASYKWANIGPFTAYDKIDIEAIDLVDDLVVHIYGVDAERNETLLIQNGSIGEIDIASIDAIDFAFISIEVISEIDQDLIFAKLNAIHITASAAPEWTFDANELFAFNADTLFQGQTGNLQIMCREIFMNSNELIDVAISIVNEQGVQIITDTIEISAIEGYELAYSFSTDELVGTNSVYIFLNPEQEKIEKVTRNNVLAQTFFVSRDNIHPILDVTFDGQHILANDYVYPEALIVAKIKDENRYVLLNDTSVVDVYITGPDGIEKRMSYADDSNTFIAASSLDLNEATVEIQGSFEQSGTYEIRIRAKDMSQNFIHLDYSTTFTVEHQLAISEIVNYPNPFVSSTSFVFLLTGNEIPEDIYVDIYSIKGTFINRIYPTAAIQIGRNTDILVWDGKDEFGNTVGKGVYFYKPTAVINGTTIETLQVENQSQLSDTYSKKGWNKLYKL